MALSHSFTRDLMTTRSCERQSFTTGTTRCHTAVSRSSAALVGCAAERSKYSSRRKSSAVLWRARREYALISLFTNGGRSASAQKKSPVRL